MVVMSITMLINIHMAMVDVIVCVGLHVYNTKNHRFLLILTINRTATSLRHLSDQWLAIKLAILYILVECKL